ncbi:MAG: LegC family aminotransferase [Desulfobacula sp.]|uniref:LegC family aminotransferase n=1 Tax=Desulfobacula sp. TaxID=2593537 RepID=UPI0025B8E206|nr:LegC family aminotransferase [Desulfobacula sp.]MCD4722122.1 LegC family aminotransferase [Desulfobacula sp.]
MNELAQNIVDTLFEILPNQTSFPLHEPFFNGNEKEYLMECINSRFVSSVGKYVDKFEKMLAEYTGAKHAIAVVNGTAALHIALKLADISSEDEVLVPSLTFVGTANAIAYCGATPHFIDSNINTLCLDVEKLDNYLEKITRVANNTCINKLTNKKIKAIIPVHIFGHPADMEPLMDLCDKYHLKVVEDAAESIGSYYKGRHTGNFGIASAISFNGNKTITTGGGGAVLCNNLALAEKARHISTTARSDKDWHPFHDQIGFNYRMPNINAALGCAQIEQLPDILKKKRLLAKKYNDKLNKIKGISFLWEPDHSQSNFWLNTLMLDKADPELLNQILKLTNKNGILTRPVWTPLHKLPMYRHSPAMDLSSVEKLENRIINIPSSKNLGDENRGYQV